jgi:hypothetical protein
MGCEKIFADVSGKKIIALANPVLSQPDMEWEWFLLRPARIFPHSQFTTYCRTFQVPGTCSESGVLGVIPGTRHGQYLYPFIGTTADAK